MSGKQLDVDSGVEVGGLVVRANWKQLAHECYCNTEKLAAKGHPAKGDSVVREKLLMLS